MIDVLGKLARPALLAAIFAALLGLARATIVEPTAPPWIAPVAPSTRTTTRPRAIHIPTIDSLRGRAPRLTPTKRDPLHVRAAATTSTREPASDKAQEGVPSFEDFDVSTLPHGWNRVTFEVVDATGTPQVGRKVVVLAGRGYCATTDDRGRAAVTIPTHAALVVPTIGASAWVHPREERKPLVFREWNPDRPMRLVAPPTRTLRLDFRDQFGNRLHEIHTVLLRGRSGRTFWRSNLSGGTALIADVPTDESFTIETRPHPVRPESGSIGAGVYGTDFRTVYCSLTYPHVRASLVDPRGKPLRTFVRAALRPCDASSGWGESFAARRKKNVVSIPLRDVTSGPYMLRITARRERRDWATAVSIFVAPDHAIIDLGTIVLTRTSPTTR